MRRPVDPTTPTQTTTSTTNDDEYCHSSDRDQKNTVAIYKAKKDKRLTESRFAKVKRILSGTLSLGRSQQDIVDKTTPTSMESTKKSARKRDRSQEKHLNQNELKPNISDNNTSPQIGLKLTKLVEYELNKNCETSPINIRKRKEHHEILSPSDDQERKLIRSNSEERPLHTIVNKEINHLKDIRRVSSHEDFKKKTLPQVESEIENSSPKHHPQHASLHEIKVDYQDSTPLQDRRHSPNKVSPNRDPKNRFFNEQKFLSDFETEHEKRRTSERFSRPLAPRGRSRIVTSGVKKRKTLKDQKISKTNKEDDSKINGNEILDNETAKVSPKLSNSEAELPLDLNTLHEQIDSTEPICSNYLFIEEEISSSQQPPSAPSCPMLLSPRNSLIMSRKVYLEPFVPMQSKKSLENAPINPVEARIRQIQKQINSIKKKLKKLEETNGATELDNKVWMDKKVRGYMQDLNKLKKELKCLKSNTSIISITHRRNDCYEVTVSTTTTGDDANPKKRVDMLKESLIDVEKRLSEKRQHANRNEEINQMNDEQLVDEKIAVQKALLHLESIHGRPVTKEDRDVVRPLYDRYRILKRIVARTTNAKLNNSITELGTILEHETMNFVSTPIQENEKDNDANDNEDDDSPSNTPAGSMDSSDTDTSSINENLHALSLEELLEQQRLTREEKKQTRRSLKEYEHEFEMKTGRKLQKDERTSMESTYFIYKQLKGKLKLIEVLIEKKRQNKKGT